MNHLRLKYDCRFLFKNHNARLWRSCSNLLPKETMCFLPDYMNAVCPVHPIRLVKTVRLRVEETETMLQDPDMNLKVREVAKKSLFNCRAIKKLPHHHIHNLCYISSILNINYNNLGCDENISKMSTILCAALDLLNS